MNLKQPFISLHVKYNYQLNRIKNKRKKNELFVTDTIYTDTDVFKFKTTKGIKIVLFSSNVAGVCLNRGLSLFQLHIAGVLIKRERYRKLTTC